MLHYHNSQYVEMLIDNEVMCHSIYDDKLYYVKVKDDTAYEVIYCDLQGNNKTTIGTITKEKETYCRYMAVGEEFWEIYKSIKEIINTYGISDIVDEHRKILE